MTTSQLSTIEAWASLSEDERDAYIATLSDEEALQILYDWELWARPDQIAPEGDWFCWAMISGRGAGKTRTGAETIRGWVEASPDPIRIALVAESAADVRDVMILGESGIITISPPWNMPEYKPSKRLLIWPNGSQALCFSGDKPGLLRGPQFHKAWVDELAKFQYPDDLWDNLELALRLGDKPQALVTTTPRPIPIIKSLVQDEQTVVTTTSTYANLGHLAGSFIERVLKKYEGTRLGRQELHAEILSDTPGALWTADMLEESRATSLPEMRRIVIGVDPAVSSEENSDEVGIVVCGKGINGRGYVMRDASGVYTPDQWASMVIRLYQEFGADRVVAEKNNGGDLVESTLRTKNENISYRGVHAMRAKQLRAEPVAALYEQHKIKHLGMFARMEDQMMVTTRDGYQGRGSPDRMDAMVYAMTDLMLGAYTNTDPDAYVGSKR